MSATAVVATKRPHNAYTLALKLKAIDLLRQADADINRVSEVTGIELQTLKLLRETSDEKVAQMRQTMAEHGEDRCHIFRHRKARKAQRMPVPELAPELPFVKPAPDARLELPPISERRIDFTTLNAVNAKLDAVMDRLQQRLGFRPTRLQVVDYLINREKNQ